MSKSAQGATSDAHVWCWSPPTPEPYLTVFCDRCGGIRRYACPIPLADIGKLARKAEAEHAECVEGRDGLLCHKCDATTSTRVCAVCRLPCVDNPTSDRDRWSWGPDGMHCHFRCEEEFRRRSLGGRAVGGPPDVERPSRLRLERFRVFEDPEQTRYQLYCVTHRLAIHVSTGTERVRRYADGEELSPEAKAKLAELFPPSQFPLEAKAFIDEQQKELAELNRRAEAWERFVIEGLAHLAAKNPNACACFRDRATVMALVPEDHDPLPLGGK